MRLRMLVFVAIVALATAAQAATIYEAELLPENVLPDSGASAWGRATLIIDDDQTQVDLTLNFAGLDTPQTEANLLLAGPDEVGTVLRTLPTGTPIAQTLAFTPELADAIANDRLAIQVHSENWRGGAIRGNFAFVIVGVQESSWTEVKGLFE